MKKSQVFWVLAAILLVSIIGTYFFYEQYKVLATKSIDTDVVVKGDDAFNLNDDKLHFGGMPPTDSGTRSIRIAYTKDSIVHITLTGQVADWITINDNDFLLPANEQKNMKFTLTVPGGTPYGNYTGKIKFEFLRP